MGGEQVAAHERRLQNFLNFLSFNLKKVGSPSKEDMTSKKLLKLLPNVMPLHNKD